MYEIIIDGEVVYKSDTFPPYPLLDVCAKIARHFNVQWDHTYNGQTYSY